MREQVLTLFGRFAANFALVRGAAIEVDYLSAVVLAGKMANVL